MQACPKCRSAVLEPIPGASARADAPRRCPACLGIWVPRNAVILGELEPGPSGAVAVGAADADGRAGLCPAGHGLMRRARLQGQSFALDRCTSCGGTWFDAGEWHQVATHHLLDSLDALWDPTRTREARQAQAQARWRGELAQRFGEGTLADLERLGAALAEHPEGVQAIAFLAELVRTRRIR